MVATYIQKGNVKLAMHKKSAESSKLKYKCFENLAQKFN